MEIVAFRPPAGVWKGIDTVHALTRVDAEALYAEGVRWVARYSRRDGHVNDEPNPGGDYGPAVADGCHPLSIAESREILEGGLGIVQVQFGSFGDVSDGQRLGKAAATCTRKLAFPMQTHHYMDVEGKWPAQAGAARCRMYKEAWAAANNAAGGLTGLYWTGSVPLTARQVYGLRGVTSYWSGAGPIPPNPLKRGCAIEQDPPERDYPDSLQRLGDSMIAGVPCDTDTMRPDRFGYCPIIVCSYDAAVAWTAEAMGHLMAQPYLRDGDA